MFAHLYVEYAISNYKTYLSKYFCLCRVCSVAVMFIQEGLIIIKL